MLSVLLCGPWVNQCVMITNSDAAPVTATLAAPSVQGWCLPSGQHNCGQLTRDQLQSQPLLSAGDDCFRDCPYHVSIRCLDLACIRVGAINVPLFWIIATLCTFFYLKIAVSESFWWISVLWKGEWCLCFLSDDSESALCNLGEDDSVTYVFMPRYKFSTHNIVMM